MSMGGGWCRYCGLWDIEADFGCCPSCEINKIDKLNFVHWAKKWMAFVVHSSNDSKWAGAHFLTEEAAFHFLNRHP